MMTNLYMVDANEHYIRKGGYKMFFLILVLSIIMLVIGVAIEYHAFKNNSERNSQGKLIGGIMILGAFLAGLFPIIALEIPTPEIYTTQGDSEYNNMIYIKCDWPLHVWYTLAPYDNPEENGVRYEEPIPLETSISISAKASFFGIKWSETVSKDIVINSDNELNIVETNEPGSSIASIKATFNEEPLFPGDEVTKDLLSVEGTTISGNSVAISGFEFSPNIILEGQNRIAVTYQDLKCEVLYFSHYPQLVNIQAKYTGATLTEGDSILAEDFKVIGKYEDGTQTELTDFTIEPSVAEKPGNLQVKVIKGSMSTTTTVYIDQKPTNSLVCSEQHTPDNVWNQVYITKWSAVDDLDINGKRHSGGLKVEMTEAFSSMGATIGSPLSSQIMLTNDNGKPLVGNIAFAIVVDQSMFSSQSSATISILVDGEERHNTGRIDASTTDEFAFDIDVEGADSIVIRVDAEIKNGAFVFGMVNE